MTPRFANSSEAPIPVHVVDKHALQDWIDRQPARVQTWVHGSGFKPAIGKTLLIPGPEGMPEAVLIGYGSEAERKRGRFHLAAAVPSLPDGAYEIASGLPAEKAEEEALGWLLAAYAFDRYAGNGGAKALLLPPEGVDAAKLEIIAAGECLTRDLINTPACDMGPEALEAAAAQLAAEHGARFAVVLGEDLLDRNFPMIHAVGRASDEDPRLIELTWGESGPKLTLVGKGVCFDTGGLNLKPGASMGLMKKDMGGAATVLGLAHMIMALGLPIRLQVLIPAVENAVSGNSFRPQDILMSRKGLTVEINNTDAEGRLVLADALAYGAEGEPDLMLSMATLTGAARVAVGPDLAPYFTDDDAIAAALDAAARKVADPVWRMPFWDPYEKDIEPGIADLDNAPSGGFAGSITAALFLRRFAGDKARYTHFDIYGWQPKPAPGRPKGGVGMGARALLEALPGVLGL
ncbi:leucyl aminopeptidase family protein [Thalassovita mangrovi]|uniref:Leucyl aminopeptidase family protein n=1 Tax=Thalassovita mangrovi TaxID=2692236 RepID=A0A6L8LPT4_9RHOB|nr:leucyl aminopeptidase family protein [Thalassovita mangrovi]MYM55592.1 leucyl aminopeptidase family protein [Thalassovita mangrovi]